MNKILEIIFKIKKFERKLAIILFSVFAVVFMIVFVKVCIDNMTGKNNNIQNPKSSNGKSVNNEGESVKKEENNTQSSSKISLDNNGVQYNSGNIMVNLGKEGVLSKEILEKSEFVEVKNNDIGIEQIKQGQMAVYTSSGNEELCNIDLNSDGKEDVVKHVVNNAVTDEIRKANFFQKDLYEHVLIINNEEKLSVMSYFDKTKITVFSLKNKDKDVIVIGMYVLDNAISVMEAPYDLDNCENTILYVYEGNEKQELNKTTLGKIPFDISLINSDDPGKKGTVALKNGQIITFGSDNTYLNNGTEENPKSLWVTYVYKMEDDKLVETSKNNVHYYKMKFNVKNKVWPLEIVNNIELYLKPNLASKKVVVKPQKAMPVSSIFDVNEIMPQDKWIYIITDTGQKGWFHIEKRAKEVEGIKVDNTLYTETKGVVFSSTTFSK